MPRTLGTRSFAALLLLTSCNRYELFNIAGFEQASFSNDVDILFVVDNSPSMSEETGALALNFGVFIDTLTSAEGSEPASAEIGDAVDNYVAYTQNRGQYLDYQLAITTTSVEYAGGWTSGVDPGEAGKLLGGPDLLKKGDPDVAARFRELLLCEAAYWDDSTVGSDPSFVCEEGVDPGTPDLITVEYLDCVCGFGEWENPSGSGQEEPLEAALLALCRASDDPPEVCYDPQSAFGEVNSSGDLVPEDAVLTNDGFLRDEGTVVIVIVSDEGDNSRRLFQGETDPAVYLDAFQQFGKPVKVVAIGPNWDRDSGAMICPSTSIPTWSVERVQTLTDQTGGFYNVIVEQGADDCVPSDFAQHLEDLGALLVNLDTAFQLQSIPDITTIRVWVDELEVPEALVTCRVEPGNPDSDLVSCESTQLDPAAALDQVYGNGWAYDPAQNAVAFWGDAVPDYNADVKIYYRPLEGKPRDLPFSY